MIHPRLLYSTLMAALFVVIVAAVVTPAVAIDLHVYDALIRWAGVTAASRRVAVVAVDRQSLEAIGPWPWSRDRVSTLLNRLGALGASVIAVDSLLTTSQDTVGEPLTVPSGDRSRIVLGYALTFGAASSSPSDCRPEPLPASVIDQSGTPPAPQLFQATGRICPPTSELDAWKQSGFLNVGTDRDGVVRRLPLVMSYGDAVYPSLALAATLALLEPDQVTLASRRDFPLQLDIDGQVVPLGDRGTLMLRFRDSARPLNHIPAVDVLSGRVAPGVLDGRIVFVGSTAPDVGQVVATPIDEQYPGIEVQASAAENLLQSNYLAVLGYHRLYQAAIGIALAMLTAVLIQMLGVRWGSTAGLLTLVIVWLASAIALVQWNTYLSPLLPTLALVAAVVAGVFAHVDRQRLPVDLVQRWADPGHRRRRQAHEFLIKSLTSLMEIRDPSTGRHSRRTQGYSRLLAQRLAHTPEFHEYLSDARIEVMSLLAPLHDIGKVGIRDAVLNKASALTTGELHEMQQHPVYGYETISKAQRQVGVDSAHDEEILQLAKDIVYTHHERWDGTGYPRGLRGDEIPIAGRIMALVDVYDALVEPRPYRRRMPHDEAVALIVAGRGTQFDPNVVEAFLTVAPDFQELGTRLRESPPHPRA
jgi:HD-GYP domain-containing protein (c-di-GMP phosphodiesterase class II)